MDLRYYLNILNRRKWVVIVTLLVTVIVVTVGTLLIKPTYTVTTTLRIATAAASSSNSSDYNYADRLLSTYVQMAGSGTILDQLKTQLKLSKAPKITVTEITGTELIQITLQDHDPAMAVLEANTLTTIIISNASEFYSGSGKTPSEILKEKVDQAQKDLQTAQATYQATVGPGVQSTNTCIASSQNVTLKEQIYSDLLTQYEQLLTQEAIQANIISVVDPATTPEAPSKPNKPLNISLGFVVGLLAGLGLAFLFESLDTTIFTGDQVLVNSQLGLIGKIPLISLKGRKEKSLFENAAMGEAFQRVKTNLLPLISEPPGQTLLITSAMQGEGKSTVVTGLGQALAQSGKKAVIVECDFREPIMEKIFNLQNQSGLCDYLMGKTSVENIIQDTNTPGLQVITAGHVTKDPTQLLDSIRMKTLSPVLLHRFDYVLLDSPSVLSVNDTSILVPVSEGVLMVARPSIIRKEKLKAALDQLGIVKAKMIGVLINGNDPSNR